MRLKKQVADLSLDNVILKKVAGENSESVVKSSSSDPSLQGASSLRTTGVLGSWTVSIDPTSLSPGNRGRGKARG
jgi:hypothetical protein